MPASSSPRRCLTAASILRSIGYVLTAHARACETCMFSHGEPPYADLPAKWNCEVFTYESGLVKPEGVYFHGADCPHYSDNF